MVARAPEILEAHPVFNTHAQEPGWFQQFPDGAKKLDLEGARVAVLIGNADPFHDAVQDGSIELLGSERKAQEIRADRLDGETHLAGAELNETRSLQNALDGDDA